MSAAPPPPSPPQSAPPRGVALWFAGARPKTLGAAVAPVLVGTGAAIGAESDAFVLWRALAALVVALALQIGVNYANDYSDGVRGTDKNRRGPIRLIASGLATPGAVKRAAILSFAVAAVVGLVLSLAVNPWLLLVGAAAIAAGALYTGGPKPYGYIGLGELVVLVFFGFVATAGSAYVQLERVPATAWWGSLVVGLLACAILLANNVRDIETDRVAGKQTLAVRLGHRPARALYIACFVVAFVGIVLCAVAAGSWPCLVALVAVLFAVRPARLVWTRDDPPSLVAALIGTVRVQLLVGVLLAVGLAVS